MFNFISVYIIYCIYLQYSLSDLAMPFEDIVIPPLRDFDDFFPGKNARFGSPNFNDLPRLNNRIINNLLYYQSNYFVVFLSLLCLITYLYPVSVLSGCLLTTLIVIIAQKAVQNKYEIDQLKRKHPGAIIGLLSLVSFFFFYLLDSVSMFLFGICLPLILIIVHAMFRLRNLKNKMSSNLEKIGVKRTPMGVLLQELGQDGETFT